MSVRFFPGVLAGVTGRIEELFVELPRRNGQPTVAENSPTIHVIALKGPRDVLQEPGEGPPVVFGLLVVWAPPPCKPQNPVVTLQVQNVKTPPETGVSPHTGTRVSERPFPLRNQKEWDRFREGV